MARRSGSGLLQRLRSAGGATAVEFALILPLLLLLYMGGVQITIALTLSRKINHVTSAVGDMVTQERYVGAGEVDDILKVSSSFLNPYDPAPYVIQVSGVRIDANGSLQRVWSRRFGEADADTLALADLPDEIRRERDAFVVVTEAFYQFVPVAGFGPPGPFELSGLAYHRPRVGGAVDCQGC